MLTMPGWKYEKTVLITSDALFDRKDEFITVDLTLKDWEITNPEQEIRVIQKNHWNSWERLLPQQVSNVIRQNGLVTFSVSFLADIPQQSTARFGILYGNPQAKHEPIHLKFEVTQKENEIEINHTNYLVTIDKTSGLLLKNSLNVFRVGFLSHYDFNTANILQNFTRVIIPLDKQAKKIDSTEYQKVTSIEQGSLFLRITTQAILPLQQDASKNPICETQMLFVANKPFIHIRQKITFPSETALTGLRLGNFTFDKKQFTHFSFRPTTHNSAHTTLPNTDIEEIGHVIIDEDYVQGLPNGSVFSDLIPIDVPWTSLISIRRNNWYALTRYLLDWQQKTPDQKNPNYRPGTFLTKEKDHLEWFQAPIYCTKPEDHRNASLIQKGTEYETTFAFHFGHFEETYWGQNAEAQGKLLNSPLTGTVSPFELHDTKWVEPKVSFIIGNRQNDYLRAGVR